MDRALWTLASFGILVRSSGLKLKMSKRLVCLLQKCSFPLNKTLSGGLEFTGLLMDYCGVLSAL